MDTKLASRLDILADNTLATVYERNRLRDLKLNYDKYETQIQKKLTQLRDGLKTLEEQLAAEEEAGVADTKTDEDKLVELQVKVDKLDALMGDADQAREALFGNKRGKSVRFSPANQMEVDPSDLENGQILQLQQRIIEDQDTNLDHLSDAIRRQRELGLLIGDELDTHAQLIDETHEMVDRTDARLQKARKKLNYVGRKVKDNRSICIVIVLIFVFFVLLALFR
ncbi:hypothetical protein O0I10_001278 [Lichtheimia ornata]|uniref:t-SNARE coiled-coil homology domain-containing protein n=1 Tax=Lichtheimia ornata TaxID=688661 RepID=A0AAD7Y3G5_9FUNG|nr:uncharacterized protein O0I10_001278 [Lichtheimia ornata]KAJ8663101.1 hypothetical protein O0I10_001278 [Lichtheimia ornata]